MGTGCIGYGRAFLAIFALAGACLAIKSVSGAPPGRPFHANLQVLAYLSPGENGCEILNHEEGSGIALHLGITKWTDNEVVRFVDCENGVPKSPKIVVHSDNFTLTAANGDEIHGTFTTLGTLDPVNGVAVTGQYQFTSGTGRFANVRGAGIISAYGDATPGAIAIGSLDGTISY